jgi:hypothetical protein
MSILKKVKRVTYTVIDNAALRDTSLSWRATGMLAYLVSLPDDWQVHVNDLCNRKTDGRHVVRETLRELQAAGFVRLGRLRQERGRFIYMWIVTETAGDFGVLPDGWEDTVTEARAISDENGENASSRCVDEEHGRIQASRVDDQARFQRPPEIASHRGDPPITEPPLTAGPTSESLSLGSNQEGTTERRTTQEKKSALPGEVHLLAEKITIAGLAGRERKPTAAQRRQLLSTVAELLDGGWSPLEAQEALRNADAFTPGALQFAHARLSRERARPPKPDGERCWRDAIRWVDMALHAPPPELTPEEQLALHERQMACFCDRVDPLPLIPPPSQAVEYLVDLFGGRWHLWEKRCDPVTRAQFVKQAASLLQDPDPPDMRVHVCDDERMVREHDERMARDAKWSLGGAW